MPQAENIVLKTETRKEFFEYIKSYIEEFTALNPIRPYSTQSASPKKNTFQPPKTNPRIEEMANRIVNSTYYPPVGSDGVGGQLQIGSDEGGGPDIVIAAIFDKPPTITIDNSQDPNKVNLIQIAPPLGKDKRIEVIAAPKEDIDLARSRTIYYEQQFPSRDSINVLVEKCKSYLRSPEVIVDGFGSKSEEHKQRRDYEMAIKSALDYLGPKWSDQFHKRWDNHRITKNSQSGVIMYFDNLIRSLEATSSLIMPALIKPTIDSLREPMKKVLELRTQEQYVESAKVLASICRQIIEKFKQENASLLDTKEIRIPRYQQKFILSLYKRLFKDKTLVVTDNIPFLLASLDTKITNKEYKNLFPLLKAIIEYDDIDFEGLFYRIEELNKNEIKSETNNVNLEAMQNAVWRVFLEARLKPAERVGSITDNDNNQARRNDLPSEAQIKKVGENKEEPSKSIEVKEEVLNKTRLVINQVTAEIINGKQDENSLLSKIFFRHSVSKEEKRVRLTLDYLKEMSI